MVSHGVSWECACKIRIVLSVHQPFLYLALLCDTGGHRLDWLKNLRFVVGAVGNLLTHRSEDVPLTTVPFQQLLGLLSCSKHHVQHRFGTAAATAPRRSVRDQSRGLGGRQGGRDVELDRMAEAAQHMYLQRCLRKKRPGGSARGGSSHVLLVAPCSSYRYGPVRNAGASARARGVGQSLVAPLSTVTPPCT